MKNIKIEDNTTNTKNKIVTYSVISYDKPLPSSISPWLITFKGVTNINIEDLYRYSIVYKDNNLNKTYIAIYKNYKVDTTLL